MTKSEFSDLMWGKYQVWQKSQEGQTSGYEYEKSFDKLIVDIGRTLLQKELEKEELPPRKKKDKNKI